MTRPVILGVVGDSGAGKTTITRGLVNILREDQVTAVATDDYHRYDRKQRGDRGITPLHPDCTYVDILSQHLGRGITIEEGDSERHLNIAGAIEPAQAAEIEKAIWDRLHFASHLRSERLGVILYHVVTAKAADAVGGAGPRVEAATVE